MQLALGLFRITSQSACRDAGDSILDNEVKFPDANLSEAGNSCRNPFNKRELGCIPAHLSPTEYTDVQSCQVPTCVEGMCNEQFKLQLVIA